MDVNGARTKAKVETNQDYPTFSQFVFNRKISTAGRFSSKHIRRIRLSDMGFA
jgi:hypothetical protein